MVSTYYIVKLFKKSTYERLSRSIDGRGQSSGTSNKSLRKSVKKSDKYMSDKCRICLKEGSIPIYGDDDLPDISIAVQTFGDIELSEDDILSKSICESCLSLLQSAIEFRKTAKQTELILKKKQIKQQPEEIQDYECDYPAYNDSPDHSDNEIKPSKRKRCVSPLLTKYFCKVSSNNRDESDSNSKKNPKIQCKICQKIITKWYYKEHYALHDSTTTKYVCDVCGRSFRQKCSYRSHCFTHENVFNYKCNFCPYRGRNSGLLKMHMKTHSGDYSYMCSECPARFLTKSNLTKHSYRHKEPQFKCDKCNKAFHFKLVLERHFEAEHLGIKKHVCDVCGKEFGYRKAMMRHQLVVHKRQKKPNGKMPSYLAVEGSQDPGLF